MTINEYAADRHYNSGFSDGRSAFHNGAGLNFCYRNGCLYDIRNRRDILDSELDFYYARGYYIGWTKQAMMNLYEEE